MAMKTHAPSSISHRRFPYIPDAQPPGDGIRPLGVRNNIVAATTENRVILNGASADSESKNLHSYHAAKQTFGAKLLRLADARSGVCQVWPNKSAFFKNLQHYFSDIFSTL